MIEFLNVERSIKHYLTSIKSLDFVWGCYFWGCSLYLRLLFLAKNDPRYIQFILQTLFSGFDAKGFGRIKYKHRLTTPCPTGILGRTSQGHPNNSAIITYTVLSIIRVVLNPDTIPHGVRMQMLAAIGFCIMMKGFLTSVPLRWV